MEEDKPNNTGTAQINAADVARKPIIAVTMGDPGGIGAEVVVKALADPQIRESGRFIIYGLNELMSYAADSAEIAPYWWRRPHEAVRKIESGAVVADFDEFGLPGPRNAQPTAQGGLASMRFLEEAVASIKAGRAHALVTAPISKTSWHMAGYKRWPGHTEWLAEQFHTRRVTMMFDAGRLRVALASTHLGLFELRNRFTIGLVHQPIDLLDRALREWFGIELPRLAVCALNPHAGEGGRFGDEETRIIEPAITMAREHGCHVEGPLPADTVFGDALAGRYDGVVAMYHDQGLIPIKLLAFHRAVNVSLGLPIVRTSPDHGTAFDIVGTNTANPGSMKAAILLACRLARFRMAAASAVSAP
ncbi:MAG TPA: 4-hydroxythreonine-4-phosphate dehydrogenase PdxA [Phycisphaerae bacterium]|nr:4-hydroxythreonine-4-phosphate dehydrogenase PdxA [Phycisphaerae bacterium]